jgi:hypothetical protein
VDGKAQERLGSRELLTHDVLVSARVDFGRGSTEDQALDAVTVLLPAEEGSSGTQLDVIRVRAYRQNVHALT